MAGHTATHPTQQHPTTAAAVTATTLAILAPAIKEAITTAATQQEQWKQHQQ